MRIEILQGGHVLRQYNHNGKSYIEAPPQGDYEIRLTNNCPRRRMTVVSVDGVNVVDGTNAGYDGPGYVLRAWESINIKGWRRTDSEVARFSFAPQEGSYSAQTGRGTKNTGVIGIAVFEEKQKPQPIIINTPPVYRQEVHHHHHYDTAQTLGSVGTPDLPRGITGDPVPGMNDPSSFCDTTGERISDTAGEGTASSTVVPCSASFDSLDMAAHAYDGAEEVDSISAGAASPASAEVERGGRECRLNLDEDSSRVLRRRKTKSVAPSSVDLGTGYGQRDTMHTTTTEFERASTSPSIKIVLQYAVRERLIEWGVPVHQEPAEPEAFPASEPAVPAPGNWRG